VSLPLYPITLDSVNHSLCLDGGKMHEHLKIGY
jgi:hypothetical protein